MNELMYLIRNIMIAAVCEDGCYLFDYEITYLSLINQRPATGITLHFSITTMSLQQATVL